MRHLTPSDIEHIRAAIASGRSSQDIADDFADSDEAAEFEDAAYGPRDSEDFGGPAHLSDDGYYDRNDAGEYAWM